MADDISVAERRRRNLHKDLLAFTGHPAFFQPPTSPNANLTYPCTIYKLSTIYTDSADDMNYRATRRYQLTYITKDPADPLIDKFLEHYQMISMSNHFTSDGLNHYIYDLYY